MVPLVFNFDHRKQSIDAVDFNGFGTSVVDISPTHFELDLDVVTKRDPSVVIYVWIQSLWCAKVVDGAPMRGEREREPGGGNGRTIIKQARRDKRVNNN